MAVVSATFESGLGLSAYIHFSCYLEQKNVEVCKIMNNKSVPSIAHGLGTYQWLKEDVATTPLKISQNAFTGFVEASVVDADQLLKSFQVNHHVVQRNFTGESVCRYQLPVESNGFTCLFKVQEIGQTSKVNKSLICLLLFFYYVISDIDEIHYYFWICFFTYDHFKYEHMYNQTWVYNSIFFGVMLFHYSIIN